MTVQLYARQLDQEMENFVKKKRTRRGKKHSKQRGSVNIAATTLDLSLGDLATLDLSLGNRISDLENLSSTAENSRDCSKIRKTRRLLRPYYSPKAPENSTQFIMDAHCENLNLFSSLYPPVEFGKASRCDQSIDDQDVNIFEDLMENDLVHRVPEAYVQDDNLSFDNSVALFMQDDFEQVYRIAREDELNEMSREDLIRALFEMEQKLDKFKSSTCTITSEKQRGGISQIKVKNQHIQEENKRLQSAIDGIKCGLESCK
ncbi:hypothetical protein CHS0354_027822 [Potamilus streckersoni]|uniref:Uncharacterized protein n=1 Tax=Potamilus streckersoni TaxID=2493646 RepID=A0AAE0W5W4_9BIVA|nr:hypothetical protein CHS0354_027822 [Potamilus streckersoni]